LKPVLEKTDQPAAEYLGAALEKLLVTLPITKFKLFRLSSMYRKRFSSSRGCPNLHHATKARESRKIRAVHTGSASFRLRGKKYMGQLGYDADKVPRMEFQQRSSTAYAALR
jgi:hypothetical protein